MKVPFLFLLIPFAIGIAVGYEYDLQAISLLPFSLLFLLVLKNLSRRWRAFFTGVVFLNLFLMGNLLSVSVAIPIPNVQEEQEELLWMKVKEAPIEKKKTFAVLVENKYKVLLYIQKDSVAERLKYGDELLIKTKLKEFEAPTDPKAFNYKKYMENKQVYASAYVPATKWKKYREGGFSIYRLSGVIRNKLAERLENVLAPTQLAIAHALLLGDKSLLEKEVKQNFSASGTIHVLAVSGLHVGIIYWVIQALLFSFRKRKLTLFLSIVILWCYAFITGLSPSVLRATTMFSFIAIAQSREQEGSIYQMIALSAFFLLLVDPFLLRDVGFQLSYLAVLGIVYFQPKLYKTLQLKNYLLDFVWKLLTVSFAAQLTTFPLTLYYFHQFPTYFLLANLFVVPLVSFILYAGLLTFLFPVCGVILSALITAMEWLVKQVTHLPYHLLTDIFIQLPTFIFLILFLLVIAFFVEYKFPTFKKYAI